MMCLNSSVGVSRHRPKRAVAPSSPFAEVPRAPHQVDKNYAPNPRSATDGIAGVAGALSAGGGNEAVTSVGSERLDGPAGCRM